MRQLIALRSPSQTTFYATDANAFRYRTLYFRQDDWTAVCQPLLDNLVATMFTPLAPSEVRRIRLENAQPARVRLMPKLVGVRPIVNLSKQSKMVRRSGWSGLTR